MATLDELRAERDRTSAKRAAAFQAYLLAADEDARASEALQRRLDLEHAALSGRAVQP